MTRFADEGRPEIRMVAGLGNPGEKYEYTPHNAGFMVVAALAAHANCRLKSAVRLNARTGAFVLDGLRVVLVQPLTYMNDSGLAVAAAAAYWKIAADCILVVSDDADLEMGRMRLRGGGGTGGHRGLASVVRHLGTPDFARLRIGIGRGGREESLVRHVLAAMGEQERAWMTRIVEKAADAARFCLSRGVQSAMNEFNGAMIAPDAVNAG